METVNEIEDAVLVESNNENTEFIEDAPVYACIEELRIPNGVVYLAVKTGYSIILDSYFDSIDSAIKYNKVHVMADGTSIEVHEFADTLEGSSNYWSTHSSEYLDVEVEADYESNQGAQNVPNKSMPNSLPNGFRKPKFVKDVTCAIRREMNTKAKNRSRNKAAKKSRAKNRK